MVTWDGKGKERKRAKEGSMNKKSKSSILKALEKHREHLSDIRDELRDIRDEVEAQYENAVLSTDSLSECIDKLSELV